MATHGLRATRGFRAMPAIIAALALVLPVPARCASCSDQGGQCPHCVAADVEPQLPAASNTRSCCNRHSPSTAKPADDQAAALSHGTHLCGCNLQPADRTQAPAKNASASPEWSAGLLPSSLGGSAILTNSTASLVFDVAELRPAIPHRILHCSWII
jgi:hypothetical protein